MFRNNKREICFRPLSRYGWFPTDSSLSVAQMKKAFPSPLEVWVVSYRIPGTRNHKYARFPSPLEVWVVSYELKDYLGLKTTKCFRPLSRYGWFPTSHGGGKHQVHQRVSVPSRGMGGFLPHILYPKRETIHKIVPPWKLS